MAFEPLQLKGNKMIGAGEEGTLTDVDDQVIEFKIAAKRATVDVPKTYGKRKSVRAGDDTYELQVRFLQDTDTTALSMIFWDAIGDADGLINFSATVRDGAIADTNPAFTGVAIVTGSELGGKVDDIGITTLTFPLLDRPQKIVTAPS